MALRLCVTFQQIEYLSSYCEKYLNRQLQMLQTVSTNHGEVIWGLWLQRNRVSVLFSGGTLFFFFFLFFGGWLHMQTFNTKSARTCLLCSLESIICRKPRETVKLFSSQNSCSLNSLSKRCLPIEQIIICIITLLRIRATHTKPRDSPDHFHCPNI